MALLLALFIRTFFVQAFKIPSGSMLPTLQIGDHLLVNKLLYGIRVPIVGKRYFDFFAPERGDIIVFVFPEDPAKDFIKRVVGIPGDVLEIREKKLFRNGQMVDDGDEPMPSTSTSHRIKSPETIGDRKRFPKEMSLYWGTIVTGAMTPGSGASCPLRTSRARPSSFIGPGTEKKPGFGSIVSETFCSRTGSSADRALFSSFQPAPGGSHFRSTFYLNGPDRGHVPGGNPCP